MPALTQPPLPDDVSAALGGLGNGVRLHILHTLATDGPRSTQELALVLGAGRTRVHEHALALEALGAVRGDLPAEQRHGRTVRWSIVDARVAELSALVDAYARGRDS